MRQGRARDMALVKVGPENLPECGIGCITDPKHPGHGRKVEWLEERFAEGLRFLLFRDERGRPLAFLEYVPGEYAWRPVEAEGFLFVHCLWVYPRGQKVGGLGSRLIQACVDEARAARARGVAAMVSDGPWMAGGRIFVKNGFEEAAQADRFQLMVRPLRKGRLPRFFDITGNAAAYRGLNIVYAPQCPMLPRSANDVAVLAAQHGIEAKVTVLASAQEARRAPSYYGVFNLVWNGRLLSDHYVSKGRLANMLRQGLLKA